MNIKGKLIEIFDTIQITETFKKREFIIQDNKNPEYPEYIKVEVIQDKVSLLDNINIGDEINVLINIKGRKWEDKEGNIKYFNSYYDHMSFWKKICEDFIYDVDYENIVNNSELEIKKLLNFCELDWDENCLKHPSIFFVNFFS